MPVAPASQYRPMAENTPLRQSSAGGLKNFRTPPAKTRKTSMMNAENTRANAALIFRSSSTGVMRPLIQPSVPSSAVATGIMSRQSRKNSGLPSALTHQPVHGADPDPRVEAEAEPAGGLRPGGEVVDLVADLVDHQERRERGPEETDLPQHVDVRHARLHRSSTGNLHGPYMTAYAIAGKTIHRRGSASRRSSNRSR